MFFCYFKNRSDLSFSPGYFSKLCCIWDLLDIYYLSVKIWPYRLRVEIFVNLGIYFLVWPAFCHGNFGKFYLKLYPNYINFWSTKALLCKLWGKKRVKIGIFSLVIRVILPVTLQLTTVFLIHFFWFTNWSGQTVCKKWVE